MQRELINSSGWIVLEEWEWRAICRIAVKNGRLGGDAKRSRNLRDASNKHRAESSDEIRLISDDDAEKLANALDAEVQRRLATPAGVTAEITASADRSRAARRGMRPPRAKGPLDIMTLLDVAQFCRRGAFTVL